jgi:hypothetical protein
MALLGPSWLLLGICHGLDRGLISSTEFEWGHLPMTRKGRHPSVMLGCRP